MPKEFPRTRRIAEQLQRELAQLIREEVHDPRVGMVTVAEVRVSRDLSHARVFLTVLDQAHDPQSSVAVLNRAAGFLRHGLSKRMATRSVPHLRFVYDETVEKGVHLASLIDRAVAEDASHHRDEPKPDEHQQDPRSSRDEGEEQ